MAVNRQLRSLWPRLASLPMRYAAGWQRVVRPFYCAPHSHPVYEVVYHPSGSGVTVCGDGGGEDGALALEFAPGVLVIYPPGVTHEQSMRSPGEDVCVLLGPDESRAGPGQAMPVLPHAVCADAGADPYLVRELIALANAPAPREDLERLTLDRRGSALWTALCALMAARGRREEDGGSVGGQLAARARRFIERHCCEIERISDVAEALDIGPDHLRHSYRRTFGVSMQSDLRKARLEHAANLLVHSSLPLKAIAALSGFAAEQYFCTCFRRRMGCTPDTYRRRGSAPGDDRVPPGMSAKVER